MAGRGRSNGRVLEVPLQGKGSDLRHIPYRITIEGSHWSRNPQECKEEIRDAIIDAANDVPGAETLLVGTRHGMGGPRETGALRFVTKGTNTAKARQTQGPRPKYRSDEVKLDLSEGKRGPGGRLGALSSNRSRYGWTDQEFLQRLEKHKLLAKAITEGIVDGQGRVVGPAVATPEMQQAVVRTKRAAVALGWSQQRLTEELLKIRKGNVDNYFRDEYREVKGPRKRARRIPKGRTVVETLPSGARVLDDGSRISAHGRHLSVEAMKSLRARAAKARAARLGGPEAVPSGGPKPDFPTPLGDAEVGRQEVAELEIPEFAREEEFPTDVSQPEAPAPAPRRPEPPRSFGEMPRRGGGVVRRVLNWKSSDPPRITDLPPQTSEEWWDNIVRAYLLPDTDPVALCHNNHITREDLDVELERRGIRSYAHHVSDYGRVMKPPPRLS